MANWCNNSLLIVGKKEDLNNFKKQYKSEKTCLDFNKIISNKENKNKWQIEWEKLTAEEKQKWRNNFDQYWFNKSGYDWQIKNWGTKWNAGIREPRQVDDELVYCFETAWSPCDKIVKRLIEMHPELEFNLEFEEWGNCFMGAVRGHNGEITEDVIENCEIKQCPNCEYTTLKPNSQEKFKCGDCGTIFTAEESDKAEQERENEDN